MRHQNGDGSCGGGTCGCGQADGAHAAPEEGSRPSRRDFLKVIGVAGAGVAAAGCNPPPLGDKLVPYLVQPEDITPGRNTVYATGLVHAGPEPLGLHAWVREGRVIKLEGNPDFPTNHGNLSALAQSTLQDLYDPDRIQGPRKRGGGGFQEAAWKDGIQALGGALSGGGVVLLTPPTTGTEDRFYEEWAAATGAERVRYAAYDYSALRTASRTAFGRDEIPAYQLRKADRIVCFGAEFVEAWLGPVELAGELAGARAIEQGRHAKFTYVGPRLSLTGSNADQWLPARAGTETAVALAIARLVAADRDDELGRRVAAQLAAFNPEAVAELSGVREGLITEVAQELSAAEAPCALPPGIAAQGADAAEAHMAVAILNAVSGAVGTTVTYGNGPLRGGSQSFADMKRLVERMNAGQVQTLIVAGPNPAFTLPATAGFTAALHKVGSVFSLSSHLDETTAAANWILPSSHELESWGDAEVRPGTWLLRQPTMTPVFDTRPAEDILLQAADAAGSPGSLPKDYFTYLRNAWKEIHQGSGSGQSFEDWWDAALEAGGHYGASRPEPVEVQLSEQAISHRFPLPRAGQGFTLVAYPTAQFYDGRGANRGWMQELPDPVTTCVWNSWVEMHPETAGPLGLEHGDVVEVSSPAGKLRAPVYLYPGIRVDTVAIPIGQGHTAYGRNAAGRGVNPLDLLAGESDAASGALVFAGTVVEVKATGDHQLLVKAQGSDSDHGREISEILEYEEARKGIVEHQVDLTALVEAAYDSDPQSPYRWGMTVDLNACTGCGACVTACYAENNLAVVGEQKFSVGREMSWIRIERWFEETADGNFQTVHLPEMCQQCGDAPCEPVCPVYAAYHTAEGLNAQVYNRCVGTRYCSNNCPYKQRRFNWFTYEYPYPLNLQLNPDVIVRQKGVMEKCTFCVQRIQRAKIDAKETGRLVRDGDMQTACQQACPTEAIVFGNLKDPGSRVSQIAKGSRSYHVLGELNTRPAVTYLKDVTHAKMAESEA